MKYFVKKDTNFTFSLWIWKEKGSRGGRKSRYIVRTILFQAMVMISKPCMCHRIKSSPESPKWNFHSAAGHTYHKLFLPFLPNPQTHLSYLSMGCNCLREIKTLWGHFHIYKKDKSQYSSSLPYYSWRFVQGHINFVKEKIYLFFDQKTFKAK